MPVSGHGGKFLGGVQFHPVWSSSTQFGPVRPVSEWRWGEISVRFSRLGSKLDHTGWVQSGTASRGSSLPRFSRLGSKLDQTGWVQSGTASRGPVYPGSRDWGQNWTKLCGSSLKLPPGGPVGPVSRFLTTQFRTGVKTGPNWVGPVGNCHPPPISLHCRHRNAGHVGT